MKRNDAETTPESFDATASLEPGITLIEASAGTGKTYAISSLYLRFLAEMGLRVDQILVVTFTVAATAELRERLRVRIRVAAETLKDAVEGRDVSTGDEVVRHLLNAPHEERRRRYQNLCLALETMDEAAISTIHGFCQRVLQQHALESGADFDADVAEESEDLVEEVVGDLYAREMARVPEWVPKRLRADGFHETFLKIGRRLAEDVDAILVPAPPGGDSLPDPTSVIAAWQAARTVWNASGDEAVQGIIQAIADGALNRTTYKTEKIRRLGDVLGVWFGGEEISPLESPEHLELFSEKHLRSRTNKGQSAPRHPLYALVAAFLDRLGAFQEDFAAYRIALLHRLLGEVRREVVKRKRRARVWSFHDLLVLVRDALRDPVRGEKLAEAIRSRFCVALVDEFQDTDPLQWEVFRTLFDAEGRFLYLIGDPKQAIYAFRGADVFAYLQARDRAHRRQTLVRNWRSDGRLVSALNTLYGRATRPFLLDDVRHIPVDVPDAHREDRLVFRDGPRAPLEIRFLARSAFARLGREQPRKSEVQACIPWVVASDIVENLNARPMLAHEGRPLQPQDVAVLVRKHEEAFRVQKALREVGVRSVLHSEKSVFESEAAPVLVLVLSAVVAPEDRRAVQTALATRIFGRAIPEVARRQAAEGDREHDGSVFQGLREAWVRHGFMRMFRMILHEEGGAQRVLASEGGERMLTDLLHLAEILQRVESERDLGPEALLSWLVRECTAPTSSVSGETRQVRLESDEDAVKVVTMHHAKGLEFGVVFCPSLWDGWLLNNNECLYRFHDISSYQMKYYLRQTSLDKSPMIGLARREVFAENLRLAYVAMTRARHRCVAYWVPVAGDHVTSPLAWLLHGPGADPESLMSRVADLDESAILMDLQDMARLSGGTISVSAVDLDHKGARYRPPRIESGTEVAAAPFARGEFDPTWQRSSFSTIVAGRDREAPGEDDAARVSWEEDRDGDALLRDFPRGRVAGRCLHAVFERVDFASEDPEPVVREVLAEYGLDAAGLAPPVCEAVRVALDTALPSTGGPVRLRDVPRQDRLMEMAFLFPVAGGVATPGKPVSGADLARVFEAHGGQVARQYAPALRALNAPEARGFMAGQMDLAFRVGRTWHLLDYKSNDLGPWRSDYAPDRLCDEMIASHYVLQYHLYAVALFRYLSSRSEDFTWERDFGGVFYLFVRGLDGSGRTGVFRDCPGGALVRALSDAFGGMP